MTADGAVLALQSAIGEFKSLAMRIVGARRNAKLVAERRLPGASNYLIGNDKTRWRVGVPRYRRVRGEQVAS